MVETAVYALLGALATALVALLALPAVSRRAFRLAEARARLLAPLSAAEAQAERDALRGRHAVEIALVDRQAAEAGDRWASAQIALGRQAAELVRREEAQAELTRDIARERDEIAKLGAEARRLEAEIGARETAMHDLAGQAEAAQRRAAEAEGQRAVERARADDAEAARARLESRFTALSRELDEVLRASDAALDKAHGKISALELRGPENAGDAKTREGDLALRLRELGAANDETQAALQAARSERDVALRELSTLRLQLAGAETDADLREAITRLGREIVESRGSARHSAASLAPTS